MLSNLRFRNCVLNYLRTSLQHTIRWPVPGLTTEYQHSRTGSLRTVRQCCIQITRHKRIFTFLHQITRWLHAKLVTNETHSLPLGIPGSSGFSWLFHEMPRDQLLGKHEPLGGWQFAQKSAVDRKTSAFYIWTCVNWCIFNVKSKTTNSNTQLYAPRARGIYSQTPKKYSLSWRRHETLAHTKTSVVHRKYWPIVRRTRPHRLVPCSRLIPKRLIKMAGSSPATPRASSSSRRVVQRWEVLKKQRKLLWKRRVKCGVNCERLFYVRLFYCCFCLAFRRVNIFVWPIEMVGVRQWWRTPGWGFYFVFSGFTEKEEIEIWFVDTRLLI